MVAFFPHMNYLHLQKLLVKPKYKLCELFTDRFGKYSFFHSLRQCGNPRIRCSRWIKVCLVSLKYELEVDRTLSNKDAMNFLELLDWQHIWIQTFFTFYFTYSSDCNCCITQNILKARYLKFGMKFILQPHIKNISHPCFSNDINRNSIIQGS